MVLPADFGLPPLAHLVTLAVGLAAALGALYVRRPRVTAASVAALAPWMAAGGTLYALYQAEAVPAAVAPFFGSPTVYGTVAVLAGSLWAALADRRADGWDTSGAPAVLAGVGAAALVAALGAAVLAPEPTVGATTPLGSGLILAVSTVLAALAWAALGRITDATATGAVGPVAVFGHALDGVSTAAGYDLFGFGEQTPLSRIILEAAGALPTAELLGAGWLFVAVKLALGAAVVAVFDGYVREEPTEGYLLLGLVAGVGLGPGFHNLVLFVIL